MDYSRKLDPRLLTGVALAFFMGVTTACAQESTEVVQPIEPETSVCTTFNDWTNDEERAACNLHGLGQLVGVHNQIRIAIQDAELGPGSERRALKVLSRGCTDRLEAAFGEGVSRSIEETSNLIGDLAGHCFRGFQRTADHANLELFPQERAELQQFFEAN